VTVVSGDGVQQRQFTRRYTPEHSASRPAWAETRPNIVRIQAGDVIGKSTYEQVVQEIQEKMRFTWVLVLLFCWP
jgi:hypothetical protein